MDSFDHTFFHWVLWRDEFSKNHYLFLSSSNSRDASWEGDKEDSDLAIWLSGSWDATRKKEKKVEVIDLAISSSLAFEFDLEGC